MNPVAALLKSRKFWVAVLDLVVSLVLFFVGKYTSPSALEDVKVIIVAIQPVAIILIGAIAYEDAALIKTKGGNPH